MKSWLFLAVAIISEIIGTSALKHSDGFTRIWPTVVVLGAFASALYFLSLTLKVLPLGVTYAVWSGGGIFLISIIGWVYFGQQLDTPAIIGIALILTGVLVMKLFSQSIPHSF